MKHLYLFTLEVSPLRVGRVYDDLPSHLTLMSRFWSELSPKALAKAVQPLFAKTKPVDIVFDEIIQLGPKKLTVHMVNQPLEAELHNKLRGLLDTLNVEYQYPQFIGVNHKAHVTKRDGVYFAAGDVHDSSAAYLIEVVNGKRIVSAKFTLDG